MLPGFNSELMPQGNDRQSQVMVKRYITIIESMTEKEMDSTNLKMLSEPTRLERLAKGSGVVLPVISTTCCHQLCNNAALHCSSPFVGQLSLSVLACCMASNATCVLCKSSLLVVPASSLLSSPCFRLPSNDHVNSLIVNPPACTVALHAGRGRQEVMMLLEAYKHYSKYATQALKAANLPKNMKNFKGDMPMNPRQMQQTMQNMSRALPPQLLKQMGGIGGLQTLMKSMEGMK